MMFLTRVDTMDLRRMMLVGLVLVAVMSVSAMDFIAVDAEVPLGTNGVSDTAAFVKAFGTKGPVKSARWTVSGLGVFRAYVNGQEVGTDDFLKPGLTHIAKRRHSFAYDVTPLLKDGRNVLAAEVSTGWWRDAVVDNPFYPLAKESGFGGVLEIGYADGSTETIATGTDWQAAYGTGLTHAEIYWGETFDARVDASWRTTGDVDWKPAKACTAFQGVVTPVEGRTIRIRRDLTLRPRGIHVWKGADGATDDAYGKAKVLRRYRDGDAVELDPGETLVVDFGQNAAGVPEIVAEAAAGTELIGHPAEMLNDRNGEKARGNDGPAGSAYIANYRICRTVLTYVFAGKGEETYHPNFSFFGGRYFSYTATGKVTLRSITFLPVMSIAPEDETGTITTGSADLNKLISNCIWGMRSNYLSVPTDCPQRNERLGWAGDTQAFCGAAVYAADVYGFLSKWMTDMRDTQMGDGDKFPGSFRRVAPAGPAGTLGYMIGWSDAGVIVPYTLWKQYGDTAVVKANWEAMKRFLALLRKTDYVTPPEEDQCADWLSAERYEKWRIDYGSGLRPDETRGDMRAYWDILGLCYRIWDLRMMIEMAEAVGETASASAWRAEESDAVWRFREKFLGTDGLLPERYRDMQTPAAFLLKLGLCPNTEAAEKTKTMLKESFVCNGYRLQTGFLGTSILMDVLADAMGDPELAYSVLLQHGCPGWLYSVDQGATTIWERWDGYTKEKGFGPVAMNSYNHYAYGAVMGWMYRTMAGIRPGAKGGFGKFVLAPKPDRRIGSCAAMYRTKYGTIESAWKYDEKGAWSWRFAVPKGTSATVRLPSGDEFECGPGEHEVHGTGAKFISPAEKREGRTVASFLRSLAANPKTVRKATLSATSLGVFEVEVNGTKVGSDFLKPGFTSCERCRHVYTYDVTGLMKTAKGAENSILAQVAPTWWCDQINTAKKPTPWQLGKEVAFRCGLHLEYEDGTSAFFGSDMDWLASYSARTQTAGLYEGEVYDSRESIDWLKPAKVNTEFRGELRPATAKIALREDLTLVPKAIYVTSGAEGATADAYGRAKVVRRYRDGERIALAPGEQLVVDFGQNCSAVPSFQFSGRAGTQLEIRHAEMLNESNGEKSRGNDGPAGTPYLASLRSAYAGIRYTFAGGGDTYRPSFTFFGYRYLGVTTTAPVTFQRIRSVPVSSIAKGMERGTITTGDARVNRLIENIRWGMRSNYLSIPTDCPQRDERLGWTSDTQVFMNSAAYLADTWEFLRKYLADLRDGQYDDGLYTCFVPNVRHVFPHWASCGWTDAGILIPYRLWKWYGRTEILDECWDSMERYMGFLERNEKPYRINHADWLAYEHRDTRPGADNRAQDPVYKEVMNAYFRLWMVRLMRDMARATGRHGRAAHYAQQDYFLKMAFDLDYLGPDGCIKDYWKGQCSDLYMLKLGLCGNAAAVEATKKDLIDNIRAHGNRLQTGFLGTAILMPTLTFEANAPDVAYDLLFQVQDPSWLYSVDQGATTVWERWNSYTKEKGFGPTSMNSFNHYAYGCVLEWLFSAAAGIAADPKHPGFRNIIMAPKPDRRLGYVRAEYRSAAGLIKSAWRYEGERWIWEFSVPDGATATVTVPGESPKSYAAGSYCVER